MNILVLTQIIPYPPDAGPRVKTWHVLRYLAERGHRVTLASFIRPEEQPHVAKLTELCDEVHLVPIRRSRPAEPLYWLRSHISGRPFLVERDDLQAMRRQVANILDAKQIDAIHTDQLTMAQFALPYTGPQRIFDAHNAVWTIVERMRENAPWFLKPPAALEAARVKRYEGQIIRAFDHTLAVTEPDRKSLLEAVEYAGGTAAEVEDKLHVVPIAVDTQQLQLASRPPAGTNILTLGTLHYPPNADGIRWFANEVFPQVREQVPDVTLTIVGKNPPADFLQLAERHPEQIEVTGYVPDLDPYMDKAAVMVVPVRAGGGMRVRILEAFARGMPVVTTTVGLEGIDARPGEDVLVEDTPQAFAAETIRLLRQPDLQVRLAERGRRLAEDCYDWQVVLKKMDEVYGEGQTEHAYTPAS